MQLGADRPNRGNTRDRKVFGEYPRSLLVKRIFPQSAVGPAFSLCR